MLTTQLYKSIDPSNFENQKQTAEQLHLCASEISNWMSNNRLKLNEEKTEFLLALEDSAPKSLLTH